MYNFQCFHKKFITLNLGTKEIESVDTIIRSFVFIFNPLSANHNCSSDKYCDFFPNFQKK